MCHIKIELALFVKLTRQEMQPKLNHAVEKAPFFFSSACKCQKDLLPDYNSQAHYNSHNRDI